MRGAGGGGEKGIEGGRGCGGGWRDHDRGGRSEGALGRKGRGTERGSERGGKGVRERERERESVCVMERQGETKVVHLSLESWGATQPHLQSFFAAPAQGSISKFPG